MDVWSYTENDSSEQMIFLHHVTVTDKQRKSTDMNVKDKLVDKFNFRIRPRVMFTVRYKYNIHLFKSDPQIFKH